MSTDRQTKPSATKTTVVRLLILGFGLFQLYYFVFHPKFGNGRHEYRFLQRMMAQTAYNEAPSPKAKAVWDEEEAQLARHQQLVGGIWVAALFFGNSFLVYRFLNHGNKHATIKT